jgi:hypothetical protein
MTPQGEALFGKRCLEPATLLSRLPSHCKCTDHYQFYRDSGTLLSAALVDSATRSIWSAKTAMLSPTKSRRKLGNRTGCTMAMARTCFNIFFS